jgi:hypothetical protein
MLSMPTPGPQGSEEAVAHRLGLSHSTVKHHLANARSKVGTTTTSQLVWILAARLPEPSPAGNAGSEGVRLGETRLSQRHTPTRRTRQLVVEDGPGHRRHPVSSEDLERSV